MSKDYTNIYEEGDFLRPEIMEMLQIPAIAQVCHQVNKSYCEAIKDYSQPEWEDAPEWQRGSAIRGVMSYIKDGYPDPKKLHDNWLEDKKKNGWSWGRVKDGEKKTHPNMVPYEDLSQEDKIKDYLFGAVVKSMVDIQRRN